MTASIAAGHPATVGAGVEILQAGGGAADVAVAASFASCVAETVMTGLLGGGHAIYYEAASGQIENLDCFVAVPGLGAERREGQLLELDVHAHPRFCRGQPRRHREATTSASAEQVASNRAALQSGKIEDS